MYTLRFKDGTELPVRGCGVNAGHLWVYTPNGDVHTMLDYATLFSDTEKTEHMVFLYGSHTTEYNHYTALELIQHDAYDGYWSICLKEVKPDAGSDSED